MNQEEKLELIISKIEGRFPVWYMKSNGSLHLFKMRDVAASTFRMESEITKFVKNYFNESFSCLFYLYNPISCQMTDGERTLTIIKHVEKRFPVTHLYSPQDEGFVSHIFMAHDNYPLDLTVDKIRHFITTYFNESIPIELYDYDPRKGIGVKFC